MAHTVKGLKSEIETIAKSWSDQRKGKSFSGTAAVDFTKKVQPSLDLRDAIETNRLEFKSLLEQRRDADKASRTAITMLVAGIVSDESEGPDSEFLDTIGRTRQSSRKSGLTRKKNGNGNGQPH